jgi:hypothetical protein
MKRLLLAVLVLTLGTACSSSGPSKANGSSTPPSTSSSPVAVTSSITSGQRLTAALAWTATPTTTAADPVQDVRFLVDGKVLWTERNSPYVFDDDGELLAPWLLGNGPHELAVVLTTLGGKHATATASVTVAVDTSANAALAGTYQRQVTTADGARTAPYRTPDKGAFGESTPPGLWIIKVLPTGMVLGDEAKDQMKQPFVEPFTVSGSRLTLYGPAVWKQADGTQPNLFCEPERPSTYRWSLSGTKLVLSAVDKVCADRDTLFVGTWTRTGA